MDEGVARGFVVVTSVKFWVGCALVLCFGLVGDDFFFGWIVLEDDDFEDDLELKDEAVE